MYQIYTFPNCEKCHRAVASFKERKIEYEEINAGSPTGIKKMRELSKTYHNQIKRDEKGWLVLPLIIRTEDFRIIQGEEDLAEILNQPN